MNYLIWDFDGTLGYRQGGMWTATLMEILQQEMPECSITSEQLSPHLQTGFYWHTPEIPHTEIAEATQWWETLDPLFVQAYTAVGIDESCARRMARQVRDVYPRLAYWRSFADALPTLDRLRKLGWAHLALTNHVPEFPAIFQYLGLAPFFSAVFNSAQTGYEKPHPQAFRQVLDYIGNTDAVWMIGDNYTADVLGAEVVGIPGILVRKSHPGAKQCCAELADVVKIISSDNSIPEGVAN